MAFITAYRRLVEVRILHSFYLENDANKPYYGLTAEAQARRLLMSDYNVNSDLEIVPTASCAAFLKAYNIVFLPNFLGFSLATEVTETNGKFKPKVDLPADWRLAFQLRVKNANWLTFTNIKLKTPLSPLKYYWSNDWTGITGSVPQFAAPLNVFDSKKSYEMGEWVLDNNLPNRLQDNNNQLSISETYYGYTSEADRRALPRQCRFALPIPTAIKAELILTKIRDKKKPPFEARYSFGTESSTPLSKIAVDFSFNPANKQIIPSGFYNLDIVITNTKLEKITQTFENIALLDDINPTSFGIIELAQNSNIKSPQNLLNQDGSLVAKGRTFEIRFQNRITYWQYTESKGKNLGELIVKNPNVLDSTFSTLTPHGFTKRLTLIDFVDEVKLPSPSRFTVQEKDSRYVTEVIF